MPKLKGRGKGKARKDFSNLLRLGKRKSHKPKGRRTKACNLQSKEAKEAPKGKDRRVKDNNAKSERQKGERQQVKEMPKLKGRGKGKAKRKDFSNSLRLGKRKSQS
jgi:hypothetical protein